MNWITLAVLGGVAAWFEYSYRRSRHGNPDPQQDASGANPESADATHAHVAQLDSEPSIVPGDQNDKQLNAAV